MLESWPRKVSCQQHRKRKHNSFDPSKSLILILWLQGSIQSHPETLFVLGLKNFWWQILAASNSQILDWQECQPGVRGGDQSPDYENWELFEYLSGRLLWVLFCETVFSTYQGDLFKHSGYFLMLNIEPNKSQVKAKNFACISSELLLRLWFRNSSIVSIW